MDGKDTQYSPPGPDFKLSREAAQQADFSADEQTEPQPDAAEAPRKKTVVESLFQAVRNGAAEALDEGAAEN
jgi:hypothetical protein